MSQPPSLDHLEAIAEEAASAVIAEFALIREPSETALEAVLYAVDATLVNVDKQNTVITGREAILKMLGHALALDLQVQS